MRLLYLYPEPWSGRRGREAQTLSTCRALAGSGMEVTLVTAGGRREWQALLKELAGVDEEPGLRLVALSGGLGPLLGMTIFTSQFKIWLSGEAGFDAGYFVNLHAAAMLRGVEIPYLYEAQEVCAETPQKNPASHDRLHELEKQVLGGASWRVATSKPLAVALRAHYVLPDNFAIVPNAGATPLAQSVGTPEGPLVYAGPIGEGSGIESIIGASREAGVPLRIVGGSGGEWAALSGRLDTADVSWQESGNAPQAMAGARGGILFLPMKIPARRYSCPLELFDYARCGLPVLSSALPALQSLDVGSWCTQVEKPTKEGWAEAMRAFQFRPVQAETARAWAGVHTWAQRAQALMRVLQKGR